MHRLLERQIKRYFGKTFSLDTIDENLLNLLKDISQTYDDNEVERKFLENTITVNTEELNNLLRERSSLLESRTQENQEVINLLHQYKNAIDSSLIVSMTDLNGFIKYANDSSIKEHIEAKKNMEVIKMVKIALDNYKIVSYFQPIINNKTKIIEKYESLVRLVDEEGNVLSPYSFLDISKKGSYYNKITHRVLENSFKILEHISTKISINLSSLDIEKEETRVKLYALLEEYKEDASRIVFELLEDEDVKDFAVIKSFIKRVKKLGVMIAIDDFGAGYSNFERLLEFEPDILKIDGSLVKNIVNDTYSRNIVETIVSFAKKQNIITIAEFVENEEIFNILNEMGVDYSQGYYFGEPKKIYI